MIFVSYKTKTSTISQYILFLLIFAICLRIPFFHIREILYVVFIFFGIRYANFKKLGDTLLLLSIWAISIIYNLLIPGSNIVINSCFETIINSTYLFLLCFSTQRYKQTIIKAYLFSTSFVACLIIFLWIICFISPAMQKSVIAVAQILELVYNRTLIGVGYRHILGILIFTVYYVTTPALIPSLAYCYIRRLLYGEVTKKNSFLILLYSSALLFSGTRAHLMVVTLFLLFYICFWLFKHRYEFLPVFLLCMTLGAGMIFALLFLTDGTHSSIVKQAHNESYMALFESDLIRTVFFGWGVGSSFYTSAIKYGWGAKTLKNGLAPVTELTHLETIRRFGFIATFIIFFYIWGRRGIFKSFGQRKLSHFIYLISILAYIFVACTNPYLIDSTGFCVLLFYETIYNEDKLITYNA